MTGPIVGGGNLIGSIHFARVGDAPAFGAGEIAKIGTALWISQNSVKQALKRMFRKLNVSSRTEMIWQLHRILGS